VEGKTVSQKGILGYLTQLSISGAHISLDELVPNHASLKMCLQPEKESKLSDIYAKLSINQAESTASGIVGLLTFTVLPDDVKTFIEKTLRESLGSQTQ
jgi:hypothetical protein